MQSLRGFAFVGSDLLDTPSSACQRLLYQPVVRRSLLASDSKSGHVLVPARASPPIFPEVHSRLQLYLTLVIRTIRNIRRESANFSKRHRQIARAPRSIASHILLIASVGYVPQCWAPAMVCAQCQLDHWRSCCACRASGHTSRQSVKAAAPKEKLLEHELDENDRLEVGYALNSCREHETQRHERNTGETQLFARSVLLNVPDWRERIQASQPIDVG